MGLKDLLENGLVWNRLLASQERQEAFLESIATSLKRIADSVSPEIPLPSEPEMKQTTVSFSRDAEQVAIQAFESQMFRDLGRAPTDEEIFDFLSEGPKSR